MTNNTYLTDKQVAEYFGVHRATPWRWTKKGFPHPVRISDGCVRWLEADILAWEQSLEKGLSTRRRVRK